MGGSASKVPADFSESARRRRGPRAARDDRARPRAPQRRPRGLRAALGGFGGAALRAHFASDGGQAYVQVVSLLNGEYLGAKESEGWCSTCSPPFEVSSRGPSLRRRRLVATWDTRRSRRRSRRRGETSQSRNSSSFASWKWLRSAISRRGFATTRTTPRDDRFVTRGCSRCFSRFCDAPIPGFRSGAYRRCATYSPSRWRRAPPRIRRISSARSWIGSPRSPSPPRTSLGPQRTRRTNTQTRKNQKKPRARLFANDWRRAWNCARRTPLRATFPNIVSYSSRRLRRGGESSSFASDPRRRRGASRGARRVL